VPQVQLAMQLEDEQDQMIQDDVLDADLGEVFTRRWVVELILDLVGYTADRDLAPMSVTEPACGEGAFLGPIIERLVVSASNHGRRPDELAGSVRAFDLSQLNVERARKLCISRLVDSGLPVEVAEELAAAWVTRADFLLAEESPNAQFVVGNPPYIRLENVPAARTDLYRAVCPTMRGRSDVYVGFIERALRRLEPGGALGFIVADRWMHNQYGAHLRRLITDEFSMEVVVEMHEVDAFEDEVSAYPAVIVIRRRGQQSAVLATTTRDFGPPDADKLRSWIAGTRRTVERRTFSAARLPSWFQGGDLWPSGDPGQLALLRELENNFRTIQDDSTGTRVGIGVATGADRVFITNDPSVVEEERLLPLVTADDIAGGTVDWSGRWLISPWTDGRLVDLARYPKLEEYLRSNEAVVRSRHVAKRRPELWYRTIDRVDPQLLAQPKLLLPDIKAASHPVLDDGQYYPHHNLYFVTSASWDLSVLGGLLLSDIANLFVGAYCVKMRGGCYRFEAQYLRKIRVPDPRQIDRPTQKALSRAFSRRDTEAATAAAMRAYQIDGLERRRR
jgi:adenine-specific DNA-methyltransferase